MFALSTSLLNQCMCVCVRFLRLLQNGKKYKKNNSADCLYGSCTDPTNYQKKKKNLSKKKRLLVQSESGVRGNLPETETAALVQGKYIHTSSSYKRKSSFHFFIFLLLLFVSEVSNDFHIHRTLPFNCYFLGIFPLIIRLCLSFFLLRGPFFCPFLVSLFSFLNTTKIVFFSPFFFKGADHILVFALFKTL